ncbi:CHAT domain-containing protein [Streptomyces sp. NPDC004126]|uniref:CHAT domain-containing protein n=1 Tax=Streptomyces sp. NPDC004126 TaxID=3390695 RepID=UPI003D03001A
MDKDPDITIRLSWQGSTVTAVAFDRWGGPVHEASPPQRVGQALFQSWAEGNRANVPPRLSGILLPPPVRKHIADRVEHLGSRYVRLRLRLDDGPYALGSLRWEAVRVPSATASSSEWRAWAAEPSTPPADGGCELGRHPSFVLVREVVTAVPPPASTPVTAGVVAIADATAVHGPITVRGVTLQVPEPPPGALRDADGRTVRRAVDGSRLSPRVVDAPATVESIGQALAEGAQVFYFGGHQVSGGIVVGADAGGAAEWLDADALAGPLLEAGVTLAVLMACDAAGPAEKTFSGPSAAQQIVQAGVPHVVAFLGKLSHGQAAGFAGRFFSALVRGEEIDGALREGREALEGATAVPVLFTRHDGADLAVGLQPTLRPERLVPVAHRVPVDGGARTSGPDERHRVHLDSRWSLAEGFLLDVLADPAADDLPSLMADAERTLARARYHAGRGSETPRAWYAADAADGRLPRTEGELRDSVSPTYRRAPADAHRGVGLVLRCPDTAVPQDGFREELDRLHGFGWDIRRLVLQVHGTDPARVRETAAELARALGRDEYLLRAPSPVDGVAAAPRPRRRLLSERAADDNGRDARELLKWTRDTDAAGRSAPLPDVDARTAVTDLNRAALWGGPDGEREVLTTVRHHWPALYRPLLDAHASIRHRSARGASLLLAAGRDDDLDRWLRSAGARLPLPAEVGPLERTAEFVDTVVLGLLRAGHSDTDEFGEWLEGATAEVFTAVDVADRGPDALTGEDLSSPGVAVALDRARVLSGVDLGLLDPEGRWPGSWTLLPRRPLTEETASRLYRRCEDHLRLLGLAPAAQAALARYDWELEEQLTTYRQALVPPLPRRTDRV